MTLLEAKNVNVFREDRQVVRDVSVSVAAGEVIGLLGPNGAGKSTLLAALAGLLEYRSGSVVINDQDISQSPLRELARQRSYLPQDGSVQWPLSVENVVALGRIPHRQGFRNSLNELDRAAVDRAIRETGIEHLRGRSIAALSGGERARALLARAIAVEGLVLLADEPIAGLDPFYQLQIMHLLRAQADGARAVVVVLHDLSMAARFCDRLVLLKEGHVVAQGAPREVLTLATLQAVFDVDALVDFDGNLPLIVPR